MNILNLREYGDVEQVKKDALTLRDIQNRQGVKFMVDCIAENVGTHAASFNLSGGELNRIIETITEDMENALSERL